jgi:hypothetical protein
MERAIFDNISEQVCRCTRRSARRALSDGLLWSCACGWWRQPFRLHEFSWEDQAYAVVGRHCPGVEELLDDLFQETRSLTDFSCVGTPHVAVCAARWTAG